MIVGFQKSRFFAYTQQNFVTRGTGDFIFSNRSDKLHIDKIALMAQAESILLQFVYRIRHFSDDLNPLFHRLNYEMTMISLYINNVGWV